MADGSTEVFKLNEVVSNLREIIPFTGPTVVSFFCGCGGLDLGFVGGFRHLRRRIPSTGVKILASYDIDQKSIDTYRKNIGDHAEVLDLSDADVSKMPSATMLLGGFPCQEFSRCGPRKGLQSIRGRLYQSMVAYAKSHRPKLVVGENVADILRINKGADIAQIRADFEAVGYRCVTWDFKAELYGVPQMRRRTFLIFIRADLQSEPTCPERSSGGVDNTVRGAIADLCKPGRSKDLNQRQYFRAAKAGRGHGQGDEISPADAPGYTIRANAKSRIQFHYKRPRRLTIRECARLQTFPDSFSFPHGATTNIFQIGNAVPPILANLVAKQLLKFLADADRNC